MRNRFRITAKSNIRFKSIKPYIGNEFFYDFEKKSYNKNWVMVGIDLQENRYGVPSIYYKYVTDFEDNKWVPSYSLVFKITLYKLLFYHICRIFSNCSQTIQFCSIY